MDGRDSILNFVLPYMTLQQFLSENIVKPNQKVGLTLLYLLPTTTTITTTTNFSKIQEIKILMRNNHILKVFWLYDSMDSQKEYDFPTLASPMKLHENDVSFSERRCVS